MDGRVSSLLSSSVYPRTTFKCSIYTSYHILPETTNPDMYMLSTILTYLSLISFHFVLAGYFISGYFSILISNQTQPTQSANISCCRVFISWIAPCSNKNRWAQINISHIHLLGCRNMWRHAILGQQQNSNFVREKLITSHDTQR